MIYVFYTLIVVFAILAVQTSQVRRAVIYVGIFALAISFCYLFYSAPDVAIAQAVITSTLGTILYLIALQKKNMVLIYYTHGDDEMSNDDNQSKEGAGILKEIKGYCLLHGLDSQVIYTDQPVASIEKQHNYDLIIRQKGAEIYIYGLGQHDLLHKCRVLMEGDKERNITIYRLAEGDVE
ncbi:hypothetical protein Amet_1145 [Alkaliphilus metalliredigens QYMF]|uniref:MrpA C-terminal/MbhD domain-containing protein n=1 Tax=Alkaliphilus metalliredigens (strain QYMF) TaxID=293826 RepID=A6TMD8_ALKMQ|nr:DUF4040 domain-containing protein [Alkaliphilus metalliredigens]ABR47356.1 hypothetical protein Amet_1145 [Alkaliphilus metalliredigens QYMF]